MLNPGRSVGVRPVHGKEKLTAKSRLLGKNSAAFSASGFAPFFVRNGEIDLAFESVHACDEHAHFVTDRVTLARTPRDQTLLHRVENVEVVRERRDVDESGDIRVGQLDQETVIANIDNRRA